MNTFHRSGHVLRMITATSLFDGHDAAINIFRRILQNSGVEVIHLGHNRSVREIVDAAIEEDVQGIAVSSYQGGHMEFFTYMIDLLKKEKASHIKVFGGGGGVIVPDEIKALEAYGVAKIYSPEDGSAMGLEGIVNHMLEMLDTPAGTDSGIEQKKILPSDKAGVARLISKAERLKSAGEKEKLSAFHSMLGKNEGKSIVPVIGITGTGGAGKSSLTDEIILRMLGDLEKIHIALISCDPSKRKGGGALLGDRIRMNAIDSERVYMRSLATRSSSFELPEALPEILSVIKASGFDLVIVETAGIGQGDSKIADIADISIYVMTSEFGSATQLEKIDMLDFADLVVINKFEKQGSEDALRDVRKQVQRGRKAFSVPPEELPVFGTIASKFNDDGVSALYHALLDAIHEKTGLHLVPVLPRPAGKTSSSKTVIIPKDRVRYLSEIASGIRKYHRETGEQERFIRDRWHVEEVIAKMAGGDDSEGTAAAVSSLRKELIRLNGKVREESDALLREWEKTRKTYQQGELIYTVRNQKIRVPLYTTSLSHQKIPKISLPPFRDPGEIYRWLRRENLPGFFPYTAGVFPIKRIGEDPTRMFAGEGDPFRTNRRFKLLSRDSAATRLSTAFDSVTLYGFNPDMRPDIYGKIGTSGVSICTLEDMKALYDGFDLSDPMTSVSMTINGPAPIILAMFLNAGIDQKAERFERENGLPPEPEAYEAMRADVLENIRGTVQADILKEDQGQNTCIFSIEFALRMMGDIQEYFIRKNVRNFYSVSISGYHIAEAGANPITQLALTLSNGFTYVEYYLSRGMAIDEFAPNLSFFFSNGLDPEYTVIGRVARRIWAIAMKRIYGGNSRSQMLKYHIQTSGRSLHSQEIQFNDIRTTLQALIAVYDNCNSLHTNAYDEAITTPGKESVRRALAIQMIISREWGAARSENINQGSFIIEELTGLVEEAVLMEFDRLTERGGVLGAMETGYQRSRIQEESIHYETLKHSGELPIIGVNTFLSEEAASSPDRSAPIELARATKEEKESQIERLSSFHEKNEKRSAEAIGHLKKVALSGENIFEELMETVKSCSLGQITRALYEVGGKYRRSM